MKNIIVRILVTLVILLCAAAGVYKLYLSKPEAKSKKVVVVAPEVSCIHVPLANYRPDVSSFGTVQSYFETDITSELSGKIISVSPKFRVGEMVSEGEVLVTIDSADFTAALATEKANLILMESALVEEEVRALQAAEDWEASGRKISSASDFVLRKPQMAAAKANIDAVKAAITKAEVDLERTVLRAPYDAVVTERNASVGNYATVQNMLGTLVATEKAEVRISLSFVQMRHIDFSPENKPMVKLINPVDERAQWDAQLTRLEATLDPQNQVSYGIATVEKPYSNTAAPLLVGSFVNVLIPSKELKNVYQLPEAAIVNDQYVWLVDGDSKLIKAEINRIQSDDSFAYVRIEQEELSPPFNIVSRPLSNFRSGMAVKTAESVEVMSKEAKQNNLK